VNVSEVIEVRAPYDGAVIATVPLAGPAEIDAALSRAYNLFRDRRNWLPKQLRIDVLTRAADIIASRREQLAYQAAHEGGKPLADSLIEIDRGAEGIRACAEELRTNAGRVIPMNVNATSAGRLAFTDREPIGVVVGISAFNHPFNLVVHQLAPAIAVGAPVIIKPAAKTPLSCRALIEVFLQAGLPAGWAQMVVPDDVELATNLATDPRVGFLSFIGSSKVGWMLRAKLAPGTRCALEHGGAAPVIVAADADLGMALPRISRGGFFHAGQACVSVQRVFCHRSIAKEVASGLAALGDRLVTGNPLLMTTDVGPLISHKEVARVGEWVDEAVNAGADLVTGGRKLSESCYANTVLFNPRRDATVMRKEIFGPVICVHAFDDFEAAIEMSNELPYSFQAAIFTRDIDTAFTAYQRLDGTAIMVNESPLFRIDTMPFAGARESGLGVGGIPYTMHDMQTEKMMVWRSDRAL
jgi:acyl-CoA reductase-like NAD-dependent aldehyde dehydrogenase